MEEIKNRILFDLTPTQIYTKYHGGAEYIKSILKILLSNNQKLDIIYFDNMQLQDEVEDILTKNGIKKIGIKKITEIEKLLCTYEVFYSGLPSKDLLKIDFNRLNIKFIFTIHGLRNIEMPFIKDGFKYCITLKDYLMYLYKYIFQKKYVKDQTMRYKRFFSIENKSVITVSKHSCFSILETYPELKVDEMIVHYSPLNENTCSDDIILKEDLKLKELKLEKNQYYLLLSGQVQIKNNIRALEALDEIFSEKRSIKKVVITGIGEKLKHKILKRLKNKENFLILDYVSSLDLEIFLKNAYVFIYPSLNEGFGYPPLQAMKYGTPVIASPFSAITEVCSNSALYFNPYSKKEIKNRIIWIENYDEWKFYSQLGKQNYKKIDKKIKESKVKFLELFN